MYRTKANFVLYIFLSIMSSELTQSNQDVPVPPIYDPSDSVPNHLDHPPSIFSAGKFFLTLSLFPYKDHLLDSLASVLSV